MNNRDGGPAYPKVISESWAWHFDNGMTMRQYYKDGAIRALLGNSAINMVPYDLIVLAAKYADLAVAEDEAHEREETRNG